MEYLKIYFSNDICNIILDYKYHLELLEHKISFKNTLNLIKNIDRMEILLGAFNVTFIYIRKNKRQKWGPFWGGGFLSKYFQNKHPFFFACGGLLDIKDPIFGVFRSVPFDSYY